MILLLTIYVLWGMYTVYWTVLKEKLLTLGFDKESVILLLTALLFPFVIWYLVYVLRHWL